jgi:hypothetical protein
MDAHWHPRYAFLLVGDIGKNLKKWFDFGSELYSEILLTVWRLPRVFDGMANSHHAV